MNWPEQCKEMLRASRLERPDLVEEYLDQAEEEGDEYWSLFTDFRDVLDDFDLFYDTAIQVS